MIMAESPVQTIMTRSKPHSQWAVLRQHESHVLGLPQCHGGTPTTLPVDNATHHPGIDPRFLYEAKRGAERPRSRLPVKRPGSLRGGTPPFLPQIVDAGDERTIINSGIHAFRYPDNTGNTCGTCHAPDGID